MRLFRIQVRRIKFWWNLTLAYIARYRLRFIAITAAIFLILISANKIWSLISKNNVVTIGVVGTYTLENIPAEILSLATQPLIAFDKNGKPIPSLASHWQSTDDGKTYIVFLKDNLKWHDGTVVVAKDISIAISDVKIAALNDKTIEFKLPNPISSFPIILDKPVFKSKSFYGTGQYRLVAIDKIGEIVRKISMMPRDKNLPRVEIKFYPTETQVVNALKIGEIKNTSVSFAQELENWPNLEIEKIPDDANIITVFFNTQDSQLSSKEFRQALIYAINKLEFDGTLSLGPISPDNWAYNGTVKKYDYNPGKAKELLSKAKVDKPIALSTSPNLESIARMIKKDWEAIGVETQITTEKTMPKNFQALLAINKLSPDPDQYALWHSTQTKTNITGYKDVKIDKLLEDARSEKDEEKRKELYFDFQKYLVEDAPAAFLYHPYKYKVSYKNIKPLIQKLPL